MCIYVYMYPPPCPLGTKWSERMPAGAAGSLDLVNLKDHPPISAWHCTIPRHFFQPIFCVFVECILESTFHRFWGQHGVHAGPILEPCWPLFMFFAGVHLACYLSIIFKPIFDRFSLLRIFENTGPANEFEDFCIVAVGVHFDASRASFWSEKFGQIGSKRGSKLCKIATQKLVEFCMHDLPCRYIPIVNLILS